MGLMLSGPGSDSAEAVAAPKVTTGIVGALATLPDASAVFEDGRSELVPRGKSRAVDASETSDEDAPSATGITTCASAGVVRVPRIGKRRRAT